ncbi:MAG: DUF1905 domain-containing protein [Sphingomonas sp.]|uniref:DUF1905 domain-containing protein n=1 Tax=Sphingomonas sp. TaxID=28214 RepID=UPI001ACB0B17|nr:DUF1905 domain-containing protein [Sphingomonas sp.]MBN8806874.1 DUF1905 domain-containing protein [Sphingomonas sp.]
MSEPLLELAFEAAVVEWRGPPPYLFATIPEAQIGDVKWAAREASYGWGCVPVTARIGGVDFTTSLFPRDGGYLLPIKVAVRRQLDIALGDTVRVAMTIARR